MKNYLLIALLALTSLVRADCFDGATEISFIDAEGLALSQDTSVACLRLIRSMHWENKSKEYNGYSTDYSMREILRGDIEVNLKIRKMKQENEKAERQAELEQEKENRQAAKEAKEKEKADKLAVIERAKKDAEQAKEQKELSDYRTKYGDIWNNYSDPDAYRQTHPEYFTEGYENSPKNKFLGNAVHEYIYSKSIDDFKIYDEGQQVFINEVYNVVDEANADYEKDLKQQKDALDTYNKSMKEKESQETLDNIKLVAGWGVLIGIGVAILQNASQHDFGPDAVFGKH